MNARNSTSESLFTLHADVITANVLVWVASVGRDAELTAEAHLYFFDRYRRLAEYHRRRGHETKARQFQARADEHCRHAGGDGPPYAAAMAMPRPRHWLTTDALGHHLRGPDDAA
jgi:hypothetical protein